MCARANVCVCVNVEKRGGGGHGWLTRGAHASVAVVCAVGVLWCGEVFNHCCGITVCVCVCVFECLRTLGPDLVQQLLWNCASRFLFVCEPCVCGGVGGRGECMFVCV